MILSAIAEKLKRRSKDDIKDPRRKRRGISEESQVAVLV